MSLFSIFADAFKKASGKSQKDEKELKELLRSQGGSLGSSTQTDAFDPLRTAPEPDIRHGIDAGELNVASSDPEEGGESKSV